MIEIPVGLPPELVPLSWLLGLWRGEGMIEYETGGGLRRHPFRQTVSFRHDGLPYLNYSASLELTEGEEPREGEGDGPEPRVLATETGVWRLDRPQDDGDVGPGCLPPSRPGGLDGAEAVERLRADHGGFDIQATIVHATGVAELYLGSVRGPRIDLASDAVVRPPGAREHTASARMYGLVGGELMWAWDIAALGRPLATHASGRLARVE